MFTKIRNIFFLFSFIIFSFLLIKYYFSDYNVQKTNKSRTAYLYKLKNNMINLPVLENDTVDIIEYNNTNQMPDKKKKYNLFWKLLGK